MNADFLAGFICGEGCFRWNIASPEFTLTLHGRGLDVDSALSGQELL